jgi:hypothetical protein
MNNNYGHLVDLLLLFKIPRAGESISSKFISILAKSLYKFRQPYTGSSVQRFCRQVTQAALSIRLSRHQSSDPNERNICVFCPGLIYICNILV